MEELEIIRGDDETLSLVFTDEDGEAFDLTGGTVFFTIKTVYDTADNDTAALVEESQSVHVSAVGGTTEIEVSAAKTRALAVGDYKGDFQFVGSDGKVKSTERVNIKVFDDITKRVT